MTLDLSPLFHATVGFDHLNRILDEMAEMSQSSSYPPYNISKIGRYSYRISMAVAGFQISDINVVLSEGVLTLSSNGLSEKSEIEYLHKGIATRGFEKKFKLAENIKVSGANMYNGLLNIDLEREIPETLKPKRIEIKDGNPSTFAGKK